MVVGGRWWSLMVGFARASSINVVGWVDDDVGTGDSLPESVVGWGILVFGDFAEGSG